MEIIEYKVIERIKKPRGRLCFLQMISFVLELQNRLVKH